jgi:hypothetical protein
MSSEMALSMGEDRQDRTGISRREAELTVFRDVEPMGSCRYPRKTGTSFG